MKLDTGIPEFLFPGERSHDGKHDSQPESGLPIKTRASELGPVMDKCNPFTRIPHFDKIEKVQQTVPCS